jgi:hypothetical protein
VLKAARIAGYSNYGSDISEDAIGTTQDFLTALAPVRGFSIVCNPPFKLVDKFAKHALELGAFKVAMIFPVARLNAARWLELLPLKHIWFLQPRPAVPPPHVKERSGGRADYCWLIIEPGHEGARTFEWLHRDSEPCRRFD